MSQQELPMEGDVVKTEPETKVIIETPDLPMDGEITEKLEVELVDRNLTALNDLRGMMVQLSPEGYQMALDQFDSLRKVRDKYLLGKMTKGVHYGYPPGTEPKYNDQGEQIVKSRGQWVVLPRDQWVLCPSLYEAGADLICDLMFVRPLVNADNDLWVQAGSMPGHLCFRCQIISKATGAVIGEGHGGAKIGSGGKTDALNHAIMMGRKRAKVKAVRDAYALSDLFTQDLEDERDKKENPQQNPDSPKAKTRDERKSEVEHGVISGIVVIYKDQYPDADPKSYAIWVREVTGREFDCGKFSQWTSEDVKKCHENLGIPSEDELK